jgi:hypothetical protein
MVDFRDHMDAPETHGYSIIEGAPDLEVWDEVISDLKWRH